MLVSILTLLSLLCLYPCQDIRKQNLYVGQSVRLKCGTGDRYVNVRMSFVWEKPLGNVIGNESSLSLQNVDFKDGGTYTCRATYTVNDKKVETVLSTELSINKRDDESESTGPVIQIDPPNIRFSDPDKDSIDLVETGFVYSTCSVRNWINSDYVAKWMRYQKAMNGGNSNLFVFPLDIQRDSGSYTCQIYHKTFPDQKYERELFVRIKKPEFAIEILPGEDLKIGGRISRKCQIRNGKKSDYEQLIYHWVKDNSMNVSGSEILNIPISDESASGEYSCLVNTAKGEKQYRESIQIRIAENGIRSPGGTRISIFTQPMSPDFNKPFQLSCQVFPPIPNAQFRWMKNGVVISNQQVLTLPRFQKSDVGSYSCTIVNARDLSMAPGDTSSSTTNVNFMYTTENKIGLSEQGSQMISKVGEKRELHCEIDGNSNNAGKNVRWYFNRREVDDGNKDYLNLHRLDGVSVSILSLLKIKPDNEGQYMCEVGGVQKSTNLIIITEQTAMEINPEKLTKEEGEPVEFHCRVNNVPGFSNSQMVWTFRSRDGSRVVPINGEPRWVIMNNPNTLETSFISTRRCRLEDDGFYTCTTPFGGQKVAELIVRPRIGNILLSLSQETIRVRANEPITIECFSLSGETGQPAGEPKFTLESGGRLEQDRRFFETNIGQSRTRLSIPGGLSVSENGKSVECRYGGQTRTATIYIESECPQNYRRCNTGSCVPSDKFCDGVPDCADATDENPSICGNIVLTLSQESVRVRVNEPITVDCTSTSQLTRAPMGVPRFQLPIDRSLDTDPRLIETTVGQSRKRLSIPGGLSANDNNMRIECRSGGQTKSLTIYVEGECPRNYRRCNTGVCVPSDKFCDGVRDCGDGSDEDPSICGNIVLTLSHESVRVRANEPITVDCTSTSQLTRAPMGVPRFQLPFDRSLDTDPRLIETTVGQSRKRLSIPGGLSVNDNNMRIECRSGGQTKSLTIYVEGECPRNYRRCNAGVCVPSDKFCDGVRDCGDGSDEDPSICDNIFLILSKETMRVNVNEPIAVECSSVSRSTGQPIGDPRFSFQSGRSLDQDPRFVEQTLMQSKKRLSVPGGLSVVDNDMRIDCRSGNQVKTLTIYVEGDCEPNYRRCSTGSCVSSAKFCNGVPDCPDGSDESSSTCSNIILTITPEVLRVRVNQPMVVECFSVSAGTGEPIGEPRFSLEYGRSLSGDSRFSEESVGQSRRRLSIPRGLLISDSGLKVECRVKEQVKTAVIYLETECPQNYRRCNTGDCMPSGRFCDGTRDCPDGSDEIAATCSMCDPISVQCEYNEGKMPVKKTFLVHWRCDGENDCGNNYDESACTEEDKRCGGMNFTCQDGKVIPRAYQCDSESDCGNNEDETACIVPQITQSRDERIRRIRRGDSVKLVCESMSSPKSHILWRHNWGCLKDLSRMQVHNSLRGCTTMVSVLTIQNFQPSDDGIYNCEALSAQSRAFSEDFQLILQNV